MYNHGRFMERMKPIIDEIDPRVDQAGKQIQQIVIEEILSKIPWPTPELYEKAAKCWQECNGPEWHSRLQREKMGNQNFTTIFWRLDQVLAFLNCYRLLKRLDLREFAHLPEKVVAFTVCDTSLEPTEYALTADGQLIYWSHKEEYFHPLEESKLFRTWYILYPEIWETFGIYLGASPELGFGSPAEFDKLEEAIATIYAKFDKAKNQSCQGAAQNG